LDEFYTELKKRKVMVDKPPRKLQRLLERSQFDTGFLVVDLARTFRPHDVWLPILTS
jgi:hypothetical protein